MITTFNVDAVVVLLLAVVMIKGLNEKNLKIASMGENAVYKSPRAQNARSIKETVANEKSNKEVADDQHFHNAAAKQNINRGIMAENKFIHNYVRSQDLRKGLKGPNLEVKAAVHRSNNAMERKELVKNVVKKPESNSVVNEVEKKVDIVRQLVKPQKRSVIHRAPPANDVQTVDVRKSMLFRVLEGKSKRKERDQDNKAAERDALAGEKQIEHLHVPKTGQKAARVPPSNMGSLGLNTNQKKSAHNAYIEDDNADDNDNDQNDNDRDDDYDDDNDDDDNDDNYDDDNDDDDNDDDDGDDNNVYDVKAVKKTASAAKKEVDRNVNAAKVAQPQTRADGGEGGGFPELRDQVETVGKKGENEKRVERNIRQLGSVNKRAAANVRKAGEFASSSQLANVQQDGKVVASMREARRFANRAWLANTLLHAKKLQPATQED